MLLLERPKRAINPQIQRRTQALLSWRKAWDVSAGRTNHAASPAEVASSAKPRSSAGYYTQILSICSRPAAGRAHRHPCAAPRTGTPATLPQWGSAFVPIPLPNPPEDLPPEIPVGAGGCVPPSRVWLRYYSKPRQRERSPAPAHLCIPPHPEAANPARQPAHQAVLPHFRNPLKGKNRW